MYQRMLRSVLVTTLSAGVVLGAVSTLDLGWNTPAQSAPAEAASVSAAPPDLGWIVAPSGGEA
ncbi:hypothetical protein GCM10010349_49090 [Streptomyces flavofungini]|nr:hypothetical protein GCM10010349_49090 [Streptomyces flavofungini]